MAKNVKDTRWVYKNAERLVIIDVRAPHEYKERGMSEAINIPIAELVPNHAKYLSKYLPKKVAIYMLCNDGRRAERAIDALSKYGYNLWLCEGGLKSIQLKTEIKSQEAIGYGF